LKKIEDIKRDIVIGLVVAIGLAGIGILSVYKIIQGVLEIL